LFYNQEGKMERLIATAKLYLQGDITKLEAKTAIVEEIAREEFSDGAVTELCELLVNTE
jgi:hypothetical protein